MFVSLVSFPGRISSLAAMAVSQAFSIFAFGFHLKPNQRSSQKTVLLLATIGNQGFVPLGLTCLFLLLPCLVAKRSGGENAS